MKIYSSTITEAHVRNALQAGKDRSIIARTVEAVTR